MECSAAPSELACSSKTAPYKKETYLNRAYTLHIICSKLDRYDTPYVLDIKPHVPAYNP